MSEHPDIKPLRLAKRRLSTKSEDSEFVCRPMRLGSHLTPTTPTFPSAPSSSQTEGPTADSAESLPESTPPSTRRSSTLNRRRSIQIKNLPIVQSPKRHQSESDNMIFALCLVDFHHARGPEIQWWKSNYHPDISTSHRLFKNLPFQALPDGSHLFEETFSNFNLVYDFDEGTSLDEFGDIEAYRGNPNSLKTLFGCSCVRQVKTSDLSEEERARHKDITRSIVQKAVVVIVRKQPIFTKIKEKLLIITKSYFQQDDFNNTEILEHLFDNLNENFKLVEKEDGSTYIDDRLEKKKNEKEEEFFVNLNLRKTILEFRLSFLVIFKALLLEKKVLVFSNNNLEMLTQFQNNLISLIPNLINNLDCLGCPLADYTEANAPLSKPTTLNTNNRQSMLRFFGLPLQIFNTKNSFWNPYLPLQQLDELRVHTYMAGCSNLLFVNQAKSFGVDLIVNLDTNEVSYPNGKPEDLSLSPDDRKFIHHLMVKIKDNHAFIGNDDHIRYQFEDYLQSLVATTRYNQYVTRFGTGPPGFDSADTALGNLSLFNADFIASWERTANFKVWDKMCDEFIFNFFEPKHLGVGLEELGLLNSLFGWKKEKTEARPDAKLSQPQKFIKDSPPPESDPKPETNTRWWFK